MQASEIDVVALAKELEDAAISDDHMARSIARLTWIELQGA